MSDPVSTAATGFSIPWSMVYDTVVNPGTAVGFASYPVLQRMLRLVVFIGAGLAIIEKFGVVLKLIAWLGKISWQFARFIISLFRRSGSTKSLILMSMVSLLSILSTSCASRDVVSVDYGSVVEKFKMPRGDDGTKVSSECSVFVEKGKEALRRCSDPDSSSGRLSANVSAFKTASAVSGPAPTQRPTFGDNPKDTVSGSDGETAETNSMPQCEYDWKMNSIVLTECLSREASGLFFNPFDIFGDSNVSKN